jgi:pimeloyl-ACP methyl ester carboxylesterase
MPVARLNDVDLYYERHGPKAGAAGAIVFAHGVGGNHLSWWQQVPHFAGRYTCLVFDHRGFGASAEAAGGPGGAAFAGDLAALLDHLGIERATLVAQSMGGWTCLRFAIEQPQRVEKLIMCGTHGGIASDEIREAFRGSQGLAPLPDGVYPAAGRRMFEEQPALYFLYSEIGLLNPQRSPQEMRAIIDAAGSPAPADAAALTFPVLFITGEEDTVIPPRVIEIAASYFPDARVERVPEAGHSVYFERAAKLNGIIDRFLGG